VVFFHILIWVRRTTKKALKLALEQHQSHRIKIGAVEMLVYDDKTQISRKAIE
jgi:hypothetical protein